MFALLQGTSSPAILSFDCAGGSVLFLCLDFAIYTIIIFLVEGRVFTSLLQCFESS